MKKKNSVKIWESGNIFAALSGLERPSSNKKTGDMLQIALLDKRDKPTSIIKRKMDVSVCGSCQLRGTVCYVNPVSLNGQWKATVGQIVADLPKRLRAVRFGSYGNPSLLPLELVRKIARIAKRWTGYTHDWETIDPGYADYMMASIDPLTAKSKGRTAVEDKAVANSMGYRTYRTVGSHQEILDDEIECPHETKEVQCKDCRLCSGNGSKAKNIAIVVGGAPNKVSTFLKINQKEA